jgi:cysteine dioxygenase
MENQCSISMLVEKLKSVTTGKKGYAEVFESCDWNIRDFDKYEYYEEEYYTRNLIYKCDDFELSLLCWLPGQRTPIHDHNEAEGWVRVILGEIEENLYTNPLQDGTDEPKLVSTVKAPTKAFTHVNDDIGLHDIANKGATKAMSLHLYAPSINSCQYYCPETKGFKTKHLYFHTEGGKLVTQKTAVSAG